jgi:hypothetical protein
MVHDRVMPYQIHNYAHNNEWLTRSLSHVGSVRHAIDLAKNLIELPRHPQKNHLKNRGGAAYFGRTRLYELLNRYELWDELIHLSDTVYLEPTDIPEEQIKRLRALGTAWLSKGDVDKGQQQVAALEALQAEIKKEQEKAGQEAEAKARDEEQSEEKIAKAKQEAEKKHNSKLTLIETALNELHGRVALAAGDSKKALEWIGKVKDLSKEHLARIYLEAGETAKAEESAKEAVSAGKNQVQPLANYADILYRSGKEKEAQETFRQLRPLSAHLDADLPFMARLAPIAKTL